MKYYKDENNEIFAYDKDQLKLNFIKEKIKTLTAITKKEVDELKNNTYTAEQEKQAKITEATNYLSQTDWVETYLIKHKLGIEELKSNSSKWDIIKKRDEYKEFLGANNG